MNKTAGMAGKRKLIQVTTSLIILMAVTGCVVFDRPTPSASGTGFSSSDPSSQELTVFAAASLTGAFEEIGQEFGSAYPGVHVRFNFAGSQILSTQLEQGALADVFASADQKNMDRLLTDHLVLMDKARQFTTNSLVVILPPGNPGRVTSLPDLGRPGLKLVLADASVPVGNYARQVLTKMSQDASYGSDFNSRVLANVVSNETDVKQVVTKIELGEADAGIVYTSDAVAAPELLSLSIPAQFNVTASYPIAVLANAPNMVVAKVFVDYVCSQAGQAILARWGFAPAGH